MSSGIPMWENVLGGLGFGLLLTVSDLPLVLSNNFYYLLIQCSFSKSLCFIIVVFLFPTINVTLSIMEMFNACLLSTVSVDCSGRQCV